MTSLRIRYLFSIFILIAMWGPSPLLAESQGSHPDSNSSFVAVPFVGCRSDGQIGPVPAPEHANQTIKLDKKTALRLAYYQADNSEGVLAPRGWHCFGTYGSGGTELLVTPGPIEANKLFSPDRESFAGPVVEVRRIYGGTSGRFEVARIAARIFPAQKEFVQSIIDEDIEPAQFFPFGPYPGDKLTYKSDRVVEYETPPDTDGLGTDSWLQKNEYPIDGTAIFTTDSDMVLLTVRLPPNEKGLVPSMISQFKMDHKE